jgi:radical SAM superfamily enzyme YgiQ (UPF0313 family)
VHLTLIHPCIGRRPGQRYIRSWQMEPLQPALLAGVTPDDVQVSFHDDRMEVIPFDAPTDLVAISVETYTARRAYQIASEYRARGVPVVMGGFHATLCTDEVSRYAESVVVGEAEPVWPELVDDARHGRLQPVYRGERPAQLSRLRYVRDIYAGKRYLPLGLIEAGRGCRFRCDFCAITSFFEASHRLRPVDDIVAELREQRGHKKLFFFVDDNFAGNIKAAKELLRALIPLKLRWVTQMSINAAHDDEFLDLLRRSGCVGVLIGFESLDPEVLAAMRKQFNTMRGGYAVALEGLRRHGIRVYGTFVFGYDGDSAESFERALDMAMEHRFYIAAFNHLTPFPGTPLYARLRDEGRLEHPSWWMDPGYSYNRVPFQPDGLSAGEIQRHCVQTRRRFYSWRSIVRRGFTAVNRADGFMFRNFFPINAIHRREVAQRDHYPLGDATWRGTLLPVQ